MPREVDVHLGGERPCAVEVEVVDADLLELAHAEHRLELGRSLGSSALAYLGVGGPPQRGVLPLREVLAALNTRTADHLGLELSPRQQQGFELFFPER